MQVLAATAGAAIAMVVHSSKTAARAVITPSPEPVSNIAFSTSEDVAAIGITWLSTHHPWTAAGIALGLVLAAFLAARWIVKSLRRYWTRFRTVTAS